MTLYLYNEALHRYNGSSNQYNEPLHRVNVTLYLYNEALHRYNGSLNQYNESLHRVNVTLYLYNEALYQYNGSLNQYNEPLHRVNETLNLYNEALHRYNESLNQYNESLHRVRPPERLVSGGAAPKVGGGTKAVEMPQVLNDIAPQATGTAGRLRRSGNGPRRSFASRGHQCTWLFSAKRLAPYESGSRSPTGANSSRASPASIPPDARSAGRSHS